MKRTQHKLEIQKRVLDASRDLFVRQGYAKTTIKDIMREANIANGSLYHFFKSKDDILMHLAGEVFEKASEISDRLLIKKGGDPYIRSILEIALQLYIVLKHETLLESYLAAYNSWQISKIIIEKDIERQHALFDELSPCLTEDDYYARALASKGILHSFIQESMHSDADKNLKRIPSILTMFLLLYNLPPEQAKKKINKALKILKKEPIRFYNFEL